MLEKDAHVLVTRGVNAGKIGKIETIEEGTFILPKRILLDLEERKIEIPSDVVIVIGKEGPAIQIK
jgi:small subunit ribosomal protein S4e